MLLGEVPVEVSAVLFDMDGTLVDTEPVGTQSLKAIWHNFSTEVVPVEDFETVWRRLPGALTFEHWSRVVIPQNHDEFCYLLREEYKKRIVRAEKLPGADSILRYLKGKVPVAIVSASTLEQVGLVLEANGWEDLVDLVVSTDALGAHKPLPDGYLFACSKLGVVPNETLVVEDSPSGVKAGILAGCYVVRSLAGTFDKEAQTEANLVVERLTQLLPG
jgi:HAD superfamily hydrolase (TIGR01509 family)